MHVVLPVAEALAFATTQGYALPPMVRSVRAEGSTVHAEVDLRLVPGPSSAIRFAAAALGTVTVAARFVGYTQGAVVLAVSVQARGLAAHVLLNQLVGPLDAALQQQGLPEGLVELRRGDPEPLLVVHLQRAVTERAPGVTVTAVHLREGVVYLTAAPAGGGPQP